MSKLYEQYVKSKKENASICYLFKSGIFYIALDEDAKNLSRLFGFKLVNFNDKILKCGFPQNRLAYYTEKLEQFECPFKIVDTSYGNIDNYIDYLNNQKTKKAVDSILKLDMNNITFQDSFYFIQKIQNELRRIYQ